MKLVRSVAAQLVQQLLFGLELLLEDAVAHAFLLDAVQQQRYDLLVQQVAVGRLPFHPG